MVQRLHGMWDLPGPGIKLVSPALAGGFWTTGPPGKSPVYLKKKKPQLFIYLTVSSLSWGTWYLCWVTQNLSLQCIEGSMGLHESPIACGILIPWAGIKPNSPSLQGGFLTTGPPRKSPQISLLFIITMHWQLLVISMIKFSSVLGWAPSLLLGTSLLASYLESLTEAGVGWHDFMSSSLYQGLLPGLTRKSLNLPKPLFSDL